MRFHFLQLMTAVSLLGIATRPSPGSAQAAAPVAKITTPAIEVAKTDLARGDRNRARPAMKSETMKVSSEKKKSRRIPYSYLLPFGVGQFEQDKTILGTTLATAQAGFLLIYFDRLQQIRNSNADAADVMNGQDLAKVRNDPSILSFLDSNEAFVLKAQQEARFAMLGFFALYTAGVAEAIFDPFNSMHFSGTPKKKKRESNDRGEILVPSGASRLVQELQQEETSEKPDPRLTDSKVGVFIQPAPGSSGMVGISVQKPF